MAGWVMYGRSLLALMVALVYVRCLTAVPTSRLAAVSLWLLAGLVVALYFIFCLLAPEYATWLRYCRTPCPNCGKRKWTKGMYEGYGL